VKSPLGYSDLLGYGEKLGFWFACLNHSMSGAITFHKPQNRTFSQNPFDL
jgi:hypothetical protein